MKVLSLTQPWATLVVIGAKHVETRSWETFYRGPLLIHASKGFPRYAKNLCTWEPAFMDALADAGFDVNSLPLGAIVGKVNMDGCRPTHEVAPGLSHREFLFGDYDPGRFAWMLASPERFATAIPAKGALGLWEWKGVAA